MEKNTKTLALGDDPKISEMPKARMSNVGKMKTMPEISDLM